MLPDFPRQHLGDTRDFYKLLFIGILDRVQGFEVLEQSTALDRANTWAAVFLLVTPS